MNLNDKITFVLMFRYLLESGIPIAHSMAVLENTLTNYSKSISNARKMIENGHPLFYAIHKNKILDQFEASIIRIGESSEKLTYALKKLEEMLIKKQKVGQNITKALVFPAIFLFVLFFVMVIFKNFIVPGFSSMFIELGTQEPFLFKLLGYITSIFDFRVLFVIGIVFLVAFAVLYYSYKLKFKEFYRYIFLIPIFGKVFYDSYVSLVLSLWATALETGLTHSSTFKILSEETVEPFSSFFKMMYEYAKKGEIYEIVNVNNAFSSTYIKNMNSAMESGSFSFTLRKLAEMSEVEANIALDSLNKILEPAMATIAGIITGILCLSIFLPIIHIIRNI
ncbi:MAG: type II secretion system F family protein [bacterium]